jgi:tetratricopeptide (TPR) repeat protein
MVLTYWTLGVAYESKGEFSLSIEAFQKGIDLGSSVFYAKSFIAHTYARSGQPDKALSILLDLREIAKTAYVPILASVIVYDGLNDVDSALNALDVSLSRRESNLVFLKVWPLFDAIRHHPRFQEVERRVGLRK